MIYLLGLVCLSYLAYLVVSSIRIIYFHPLRHIPGPKLWIAFPIVRNYKIIKGELDIEIRRYHGIYGEVVRLGPNDVSFITAQAWKDIYGHANRLPKATLGFSKTPDILRSDDADHARFRKALSHGFSARGMQAMEPSIVSYVDTLIERLKGFAEAQVPVDMVKWYNLATFDIIGDLAFGESFGGLRSSEYHYYVSMLFDSVKLIAFTRFRMNYPLTFKIFSPFLSTRFMEARKGQLGHARETVQRRIHSPHPRHDFMESMLRHRGDKDGLSDAELESNATVLIFAGSETTATLLSGVTYWLLRNPTSLETATREVRTTMKNESDITFQNISTQLPYLLACLDEALRMYPPVPTGLQRAVPSPMTVSGVHIPQDTRVFVHQSAAYRSALNFHQPESFIPERWLPEAKENPQSPFYNDNREAFQPFSVGPRNCIGRNLAYSEMRLILARVLWNFDIELCQESYDWNQQRSYVLWEKPELMCRVKARNR
ncbi:cytochrome P450 [Aspergillus avenaceus]|uniref:Cytochrome P450 n=1 Tax=Aspergillus avenaceus TaxID=36643 RepID=A0A5N6U3A4_ASPAV|nr:cytochrome P450 [Aspergillus avenaceus]